LGVFPFGGERIKLPGIPISKKEFSVSRRTFEKMVKEAIETIPPELKEQVENVAFVVEKDPSDLPQDWEEEEQDLLGLYHGIPLTHRTSSYNLVPPDKISIYQEPIEAICRTNEEVRRQVRVTVLHELAHYFGISDERLHELGMG